VAKINPYLRGIFIDDLQKIHKHKHIFVVVFFLIIPTIILNAHSYSEFSTKTNLSSLLPILPGIEEKQVEAKQTKTIFMEEQNQYPGEGIINLVSSISEIKITVDDNSNIGSPYVHASISPIQNPLSSLTMENTLPVKELSSSKEVIDFLIEREGNASFVNPNHPSNDPFGLYNDPEGNCTVGIGHLLHSGACTVEDKANHTNEFPNGMKKNDALKLFEKDLSETESHVKSVIEVPITQNQYDALVSFVYNEGINVFISSKLLKDVNEFNHDPKTIENDFLQYTRNDWLTDRRIVEANMFNHGDYGE
jgi:GH24 family phage-related lysozyme (muramidase)